MKKEMRGLNNQTLANSPVSDAIKYYLKNIVCICKEETEY